MPLANRLLGVFPPTNAYTVELPLVRQSKKTVRKIACTQRHAVGAKVRVFVRNPDELGNERAELARLLNKPGTCFLHETSLSTTAGYRSPLHPSLKK
jgi:hypothetical protein